MEFKFVTLTPDNLASEHLSCIIRTKKAHPGVEAKRRWLAERLPEGHIFRKLDAKEKETAFIEYAPLETCLLYTSPSPRDRQKSRMPSSA